MNKCLQTEIYYLSGKKFPDNGAKNLFVVSASVPIRTSSIKQ